MTDSTLMLVLERWTPPADDVEPDWDDVLARARPLVGAAQTSRSRQLRLASAFAVVAAVGAVATATPVGAAVAKAFDEISSWAIGHPARLYQVLKDTPFTAPDLPAGLQVAGPAAQTQRDSIPGWDIVWGFRGNSGGSVGAITVDYFVAQSTHVAKLDLYYLARRVRLTHADGARIIPTGWKTPYPSLLIEDRARGAFHCPLGPRTCVVQLSVTRLANVNVYVTAAFGPHNTSSATMHDLDTMAINFLHRAERSLARNH